MQAEIIQVSWRQSIMINDDTHDKLTKAYINYFKSNEAFESRKSHRTHAASRRWLREIRKLAKERMDEIHDTYQTKKQAKDKGK
jgi:hypothetical protein